MSDATQAETVELGHIHHRAWLAKLTKFERLHRDYLAAGAAYADPDGPDDDEVKTPLSDKLSRPWSLCRSKRRASVWRNDYLPEPLRPRRDHRCAAWRYVADGRSNAL
jgi:hypothetical protein